MNIIIRGKHTEVPEAVQEYVQKKLGRLTRYLQNISDAKVEITHQNSRSTGETHVVQATVVTKRAILRSEERASNVYTAVDAVANVLERQIERYKGRRYRAAARPVSGPEPASLPEGEAEEEEDGELEAIPANVVRVKRFPIKPMTVDEAVEQMELLGHNFFVFRAPEHSRLHVVYRRRDGSYGLIEPEPL